MFRSWTERLFGGVCGGLAQVTPFRAWIWRVLFVLLTLATSGIGALIYISLWWLLPLESPTTRQRASRLTSLLALVITLGVIIGYVTRSMWVSPTGADVYLPSVLLVLAFIFLAKQIRTRRIRGNVVWGVVAVLIPIAMLISAWGILPMGVTDVLVRSTGALLVFAGLSIFLRDRVSFGTVIALVLSGALVSGMAVWAYSSRVNTQRTENQISHSDTVTAAVTTLQINLTSLDTDIQVFSASPNSRDIVFQFAGSPASTLEQTYSEEGAIATFTLTEKRPLGLPALDTIGRGTLSLELPQGIAIAIAFAGGNGTANFDMASVNLERLNLNLAQGDAVVTLPVYQPLSPSVAESPGEWVVNNGNLRVVLDPSLGGQFLLNKASNQRPLFDDILYALEDNLNEWLLTARQYDASTAKIRYILTVPQGQIRLDTAPPSGG